MDASIALYTFKEGLLSKLAHDLCLTVTRFEVRVRGTDITGRFEPRSIRVDGVMRDGVLLRDAPSDGDKQKILSTLLGDVLRANEHNEITFVGRTSSREPPFPISGQLTLCGVSRPVTTLLTLRADRLVGELELVPSQWGIKPYRALGGALKVQDRVRIAIQTAADWAVAGQELNPAIELVFGPGASRISAQR